MLDEIFSLIRFTTTTSLVTIGSLALVAYYTKPTNESLQKHFNEQTKREINKVTTGNVIENLVYKGMAAVGLKTIVDTEIDDYVLFKYGRVIIQGQYKNYEYLGIAGSWISLK